MTGDSYSGITVPIISQLISNGNEDGMEPLINLKGYVLGNPVTNPDDEFIYSVPFAHRSGLISDELYESLQSCGNYYGTECEQYHEAYEQCLGGINPTNILEPLCRDSLPEQQPLLNPIRSWVVNNLELLPPISPDCENRYIVDEVSESWLNDDAVREALHIRKGSTGRWRRCNTELPYSTTTMNSINYHVNLSTKGFRSLIYSGDHDMIASYIGTQDWIRSLNYSVVDEWRPWIVQGQVAGYTRTYSNMMTFATVKGGRHVAPSNKRLECSAMFGRWIAHQPL